MKLTTNEQIIKEWNYGKKNIEGTVYDCTLTVTNKRVVQSQTAPNCYKQFEMDVNEVKSINSSKEKIKGKRKIGALVTGIIFLVIAISAFVSYAIMPMMVPDFGDIVPLEIFLILGGVFGLIGLILFIVGLTRKKGVEYITVQLNTATQFSPVISIGSAKPFKEAAEMLGIFKFNEEEADKLVEEIGEVIMEAKTRGVSGRKAISPTTITNKFTRKPIYTPEEDDKPLEKVAENIVETPVVDHQEEVKSVRKPITLSKEEPAVKEIKIDENIIEEKPVVEVENEVKPDVNIEVPQTEETEEKSKKVVRKTIRKPLTPKADK